MIYLQKNCRKRRPLLLPKEVAVPFCASRADRRTVSHQFVGPEQCVRRCSVEQQLSPRVEAAAEGGEGAAAELEKRSEGSSGGGEVKLAG